MKKININNINMCNNVIMCMCEIIIVIIMCNDK